MNWLADEWFAQHHAANLTSRFQTFWLAHYGKPEDYAADSDEQHEYWVRCAFCLIGWLANKGEQ